MHHTLNGTVCAAHPDPVSSTARKNLRVGKHRLLVVAVLAGTALLAYPATSTPDSTYCAGLFLGECLYWQPEDGFNADTTNWDVFNGFIASGTILTELSVASVARSMVEYRLYRLRDPSAVAVALLIEIGYPCISLSRYNASLPAKFTVPLPGMSRNPLKHNLVSEFLWERLTNAAVRKDGRHGFTVAMSFGPAGSCRYDDTVVMDRGSQQILGVGNFPLSFPDQDYFQDLTVQRALVELYLIAGANETADMVRGKLESAMDRTGLGLEYRVPEMITVVPLP